MKIKNVQSVSIAMELSMEFFPEKFNSDIKLLKDSLGDNEIIKDICLSNTYDKNLFKDKLATDFDKHKLKYPYANFSVFKNIEIKRLSQKVESVLVYEPLRGFKGKSLNGEVEPIGDYCIDYEYIKNNEGVIIASAYIQFLRTYNDEVNGQQVSTPETASKQTSSFPKELDNESFRKILDLAKKKGLIDNHNKWNKGLQLLSCFAKKVSEELNLGKGINPDDTKRISWKPFEQFFNIKTGKLRSNLNDIKNRMFTK